MKNNKILFIGPSEMYSTLVESYPYWDFQSNIETLQPFAEALNASGGKLFSSETPCLIFYGRLFFDPTNKNISPITVDKQKDYFAKIIGYLTPYVNIQILTHHQDEKYTEELLSMVKEATEDSNSIADIINYEDFNEDLIANMRQYIEDEKPNYESIRDLLDIYEENEETDEVEGAGDISEDKDEKNIDLGGTGKVISITSTKGGAGKSTTSALVASYLDKYSDKKVCLVDLDIISSQMGILLGPMKPTILHAFETWNEKRELSKSDLEECISSVRAFKNVDVFLFPDPKWVEYFTMPFYNYFIEKLKTIYDIILLDTSSIFVSPLSTQVVFPKSNHIVIVMDNSRASKRIVSLIMMLIKPTEEDGLGIPKNNISIVYNRVIKDVPINFEELEKISQGVEIVAMLPESSKFIAECVEELRIDKVLENEFFLDGIKTITERAID